MKKIQVIIKLNEETERFEAVTIKGEVLYTAAKKADLKTSIKRSKKYDLEIVEEFVKPEVKTNKPQDLSSMDQKDHWHDYRTYIQTHANGTIKATGELVTNFCKNFYLRLSKKKRSLTFERVLEDMEMKGMVKRASSTGKYKKLIYTLVEDL